MILSYMVILVLSSLSVIFVTRSASESKIAQEDIHSTQAFWLSEGGVAKAIKQLPATDTINETMPVGGKSANINVVITPVTGYASRYEIISTGSISNVQRQLKVIVELSGVASPGSITNAIETTGGFEIKGSVDIDPSGAYKTDSTLSFESVFGASKDTVKSIANHLYLNPPANQQPINGITWVDLTGDTPATATKYSISSNWSGSGLLVIDGHRNDLTKDIPALEISGNWDFTGMIWIFGKLKITGTPVITGGVFADSSVDVDSTLTGNATLTFSSSEIGESFGLLSSLSVPSVVSWNEI